MNAAQSFGPETTGFRWMRSAESMIPLLLFGTLLRLGRLSRVPYSHQKPGSPGCPNDQSANYSCSLARDRSR